jgi:hypothetical protein
MDESEVMGLDKSHTSPFTFASSTFLAKPSEMDFATSYPDTPLSKLFTAPSGKLT